MGVQFLWPEHSETDEGALAVERSPGEPQWGLATSLMEPQFLEPLEPFRVPRGSSGGPEPSFSGTEPFFYPP